MSKALALAIVLLILSGCSTTPNTGTPWRIVVIPAMPSPSAAYRGGVERAQAKLASHGKPVDVTWSIPARPGDRNEQNRLLREAAGGGAQGILLAPTDSRLLADAIDEVTSRGVMVVVIDMPVLTSQPVTRVGSDNREIGRAAARLLGESLGGKGNVLLLRVQIQAAHAEEREEGFLEVLLTRYPDIRLVASDYHGGPSVESATRVSGTLLRMHGTTLDGAFASTEPTTRGLLDAIKKASGVKPGIRVVGVDEGGQLLDESLRTGELHDVVREDPATLGYRGMLTLFAEMNGRHPRSGRQPTARVMPSSGETRPPVAPSTRPLRIVPELNLELIQVPAGTVTLGSAGEGGGVESKATMVHVPAFWLGRCEVTQAQWEQVMGGNPSFFRGADRPVESVSWEDATEFCRRLTDREHAAGRLARELKFGLPTEAQWEHACRAGSTSDFYASPPESIGWFATTSGVYDDEGRWHMGTHPVGGKQPNAWGFYDMCGNAAEWCADWHGPLPGGTFENGYAGPTTGTYRVLRGGSWWADVQNCKSASRHRGPPTRSHSALGFRVVVSRSSR